MIIFINSKGTRTTNTGSNGKRISSEPLLSLNGSVGLGSVLRSLSYCRGYHVDPVFAIIIVSKCN